MELISWYDNIKRKISKLESKQDSILEATNNLNQQAKGLQATTKEIENQTPYCNAVIEGNSKPAGDEIDRRILIDLERKAKQILVIITDNDTVIMHDEHR